MADPNTLINFALVAAPTPEPYDKTAPTKQQENFFFRLNQMCDQLKVNGIVLTDESLQALKDLQWNNINIDLGPFKINLSARGVHVDPSE